MGSIDPKIRLAKKSQTVPYWTLLLLRFIIALVYIFAGVSKMNEDSIRGMPILYWLERNPRRLNMEKQPLFAMWLSWSDLMVNLISPFLFLVGGEYRLYACLLACGKTLESFPFVVILIMSSILFEPDWPLQVINVCHKKKAYTIPPIISRKESKPLFKRERRTIFLLLVFCSVQIMVLLRHYMYPGNVIWTEIGCFFLGV